MSARIVFVLASLLLFPTVGRTQTRGASPPLTVVNAGPNGEIAALDEANEIRVVFSEPMVNLGRIPRRVQAPFFQVTPAIAGSFRWSGTTTLIFTPDPKRPLPYATTYDVTIGTGATAISGKRLAKPYTFSFTTPTVRLLSTTWYRRGDRAGAPMVIVLQFNQPVRPADIAAHVRARFKPHDWDRPAAPRGAASAPFLAKVKSVEAVVKSEAPVATRLTTDWDRKRFPPSRNMVVLESAPVPPEAWVEVTVGADVPSPAGVVRPGRTQSYTIQTEKAFFIDGFQCASKCDPEDHNPLVMRSGVHVDELARKLTVTDVTNRQAPQPVGQTPAFREQQRHPDSSSHALTLEYVGIPTQPPARTYQVTVDASLTAVDGQTLGYTWTQDVENWHRRAFTSFGGGNGVWELGGGFQLPFYARNFRTVKQWAAPLATSDIMPTLLMLQEQQYDGRFAQAPETTPVDRQLGVTPDRIQSHGLDVSKAVGREGTGVVWAAVEEGTPIERSAPYDQGRIRASLVQVTNLGISVKDSPQNTLIFVTRLDNGAPVGEARVSIVNRDNETFWSGRTARDGVAIAPRTPLRDDDDWWRLKFIVIAEKDGDVAYAASDWNEGIQPWDFGTNFNLRESEPLLRGTVFSDRGVYRLGEEVQFKAVLRHNTPHGIQLLPAGTAVNVSVRDSQDREIDKRVVKLNAWSSAEWKLPLAASGALGNYSVRMFLERDRYKPVDAADDPERAERESHDREDAPWDRTVNGSFLVAAYRRPDFRVDVALEGKSIIAGDEVRGTVTAKYLFGTPMGGKPLTWRWTKSPAGDAPAAVRERWPAERWHFGGPPEQGYGTSEVAADAGTLEANGQLAVELPTKRDAGVPYLYTLEGDVEDVSRQHIANRTAILVHPAPWYVGIKNLPYFVDERDGFKTEIVAVSPDGRAVAGVPVQVTLTQIQWTSVRRAEGNGFYTWETQRKEFSAGEWNITSANDPVPLQAALKGGGYFILKAVAREESGRYSIAQTSFYALGGGYTAWMRFDHNRIELVPEKKTYKPGDTARIMIQSPWERATALVTTEREGVRTHRQFTLTSTQQSIDVPIKEDDIPNVFVSVLLVKGRTAAAVDPAKATDAREMNVLDAELSNDPSDPGKPAFRLGYVELLVDDRTKRLTVAVNANREEYRPATDAQVRLSVTDHQGRGAASEVTLWAVDYGVLSLTAYRTPDVLGSVYMRKALQVLTADNRQRIISRRVLTPKGSTEGGGGGADAGAGTMRKDFRVLAFWLGSVVTDAAGRATVDVKLPESLTTYRIMAVAADRASRFGNGDSEVRVNKPLTLKPTFPRFLAVGDRARFGAVITNQLPSAGDATITIKSLDPAVLEIAGAAAQTVTVGAGGSVEARFEASGKTIGRARVQMTVKLANESDAFEDVIPVEVLASPETVAAYGQVGETATSAREGLTIPKGVVPGFGGLSVELSSTAMVGLGEGARYLVEYPYGCAEQRGSRTLALLLAADLGDAFTLPGVDTAKMRPAVQESLKELETFQCPSGGFAYWPGACMSQSAYLTSYLLHVFKTAADLKYDVNAGMRARAYAYLEAQLAQTPPENEGWWPSYTAWQAFAVKVLAEGGHNQDSNITRVYGYRQRMPVFALAFLHDALLAKGESNGPRVEDLRRRINNAILPEAGSAHVEELNDPYLLWYWNSNVRSTAIALGSLVRAGASESLIRPMVRWMMSVRKDGRWSNTQENAWAMEALVSYYRKYETTVPDFRAVVTLAAEEIASGTFKGRSTDSETTKMPMETVLAKGAPGTSHPLTFTREGAGTLFYTARLRYAADRLYQRGLDAGFNITRTYAPFVEKGEAPPPTTAYNAGDLVRVTLRFELTKERRFVAVTDPLPAGFEPVESWFATTAASLATRQDDQGEMSGWRWWEHGGFDHVERHDDRIQLFATRLGTGTHEFTYIVRATTAGTFRTAPARAEEMYEPEVFGRTATTVITVR